MICFEPLGNFQQIIQTFGRFPVATEHDLRIFGKIPLREGVHNLLDRWLPFQPERLRTIDAWPRSAYAEDAIAGTSVGQIYIDGILNLISDIHHGDFQPFFPKSPVQFRLESQQ